MSGNLFNNNNNLQTKNEKGRIFLMTNDKVRLTTLVHATTAVRPATRCLICNRGRRAGADVCYSMGQLGHSEISYKTETSSSNVGCLRRDAGDKGVLRQELCTYSSLFHLVLKLSEGKTKDLVCLKVSLEPCSDSKGKYKAFPSKIRNVFIKMKFLDKTGQVLESKYLTTVHKNPDNWKDLNLTNDRFCSVDLIRKCLQADAYAVLGDLDDDHTVERKPVPYEFVEIQLEVKLEVENHAKFWLTGQSSKCCILNVEDTHHQRQTFSIHQPQRLCLTPSVSSASTSNYNIETPSSSTTTTCAAAASVTEPPSSKRSRKDGTTSADSSSTSLLPQPTFVSKYAEVVTLILEHPLGANSQQFFVPKSLLRDHSPVFRAMFDVNMQEKITGEVVLPEDVSPEAVESFLDLLFDKIQLISWTNAALLLEVLGLTHLYQMYGLLERVLETIICIPQETLNVQLAVSIFGAGEKYDINDLKFRAMQWIILNKEAVLSDTGKGELDKAASGTPRIFSSFMEWLL